MNKPKDEELNQIIELTKAWIQKFVIRYNLCPFAKFPFEQGKVKYVLCETNDIEDWVMAFVKQSNLLIQASSDTVSTTLIVFSGALQEFEDFLDIVETYEQMLLDSGTDEIIQLASFHPNYCFEGTTANDITNYTNRAPFPIIQLLRINEVARAIQTYPNIENIPFENQKKMQDLGLEKIDQWKNL